MSRKSIKPGGLPLLQRVKPSYIILLAVVPIFIVLFVVNSTYNDVFNFIIPGIKMTLILTITGYLLASFLGLILAGIQFLVAKPRTHIYYSLFGLGFVVLAMAMLLLPKNNYVLFGEESGLIAIVKNTPREISNPVRFGTYSKTAEERGFRSVKSAKIALERLSDPKYDYTAALLLKQDVPDGSNVLWEKSVMRSTVRNVFSVLIGIGVFTLLLSFASWHSAEHPLAIFAELYIDLVRGIPMLVLILFIGLIMPKVLQKMGILFEPKDKFLKDLQRGTLGIGIAYAAYMAEIFRAGIQAIPKGQLEAGRSVGLSGKQVVRFIILPQALKIVLPPLGNDFIAMIKDTAIISLIGAGELFRKTREYGAHTFNYLPAYYTVSFIYVLLTFGSSSILKWLEKKTNNEER